MFLVSHTKLSLVAFDPGDKNVGIAEVKNGSLTRTATITPDALYALLAHSDHWADYPVWVIEEFLVRPNIRKGYYRPVTAHLIGALQLKALQSNARYVGQQPNIPNRTIPTEWVKDQGWSWNTEHELDALKHILFYALQSNKRKGRS